MHFARIHHLLIFVTVIVAISIQLSVGEPRKECKYWCKDKNDAYHCCPSVKKKHHKNPLLHWAYEELFGLHDQYPWLQVDTSWIYSLWPVFFKRSADNDDDGDQPEEFPQQEEHCPKLREACPRKKSGIIEPPSACSSSEECKEEEKCCYDVCLQHRTCKPIVEAHKQ